MISHYRLTKLIMMWLDNNCPWIHSGVSTHTRNLNLVSGLYSDRGKDIIFIQGYDHIHVLDNKWVEVQPSYMVNINDPDFFRKLARRLGVSREIRQMDRLLDASSV